MKDEFKDKKLSAYAVMTSEEVFALRDYDHAYDVTEKNAKFVQNALLEAIEQARPGLFKPNPFTDKAQPEVGL